MNPRQLGSLNAWLARCVAARCSGPVRAVWLDADEQGCATARHLAQCGTQELYLWYPEPEVLEVACAIHSLTGLALKNISDLPASSLQPLDALRQLQFLELDSFDNPASWAPRLPCLTQLAVSGARDLHISLDGCSALQLLWLSDCDGTTLAASRALQQLTRLELEAPVGLELPWQHMRELQGLSLQCGFSPGPGVLEGATQLTTLRSLLVGLPCHVPRGAWLAGVARLVVGSFESAEVGGWLWVSTPGPCM